MALSMVQIAFFLFFFLFLVSFASLIGACLYFNKACMKEEVKEEQSESSQGDRKRVSYQKKATQVKKGVKSQKTSPKMNTQQQRLRQQGSQQQEPQQQKPQQPVVTNQHQTNEPPMPQWLFKEHITPSWCTDGTVVRPIMGTKALEEISSLGRVYAKPDIEAVTSVPNGNAGEISVTIESVPADQTPDEPKVDNCTPTSSSTDDTTLPEKNLDTNPNTNDVSPIKQVLPTIDEMTIGPVHAETSNYSSGLVSSGSIQSSDVAQLVGNNLRASKTSPVKDVKTESHGTFKPYGRYEIFVRNIENVIRKSMKRKRPESIHQENYSPKFPITTSVTSSFEFPFTHVLRRDFPTAKILDQLEPSSTVSIEVPASTQEEEKEETDENSVIIEIPDDDSDLGTPV